VNASAEYSAAYEAAKVADNAYEAACVAEYGGHGQRWRVHTAPALIAARAAKVAADERVRAALAALHARVRATG
jgi:hypothetical protein